MSTSLDEDLEELMLTTEDNPFNPFTQFTRWVNYDCQMGYNTCGRLAREAAWSSDCTDEENRMAQNIAIRDIVSDPAINFVLSRDGTKKIRLRAVTKKDCSDWN